MKRFMLIITVIMSAFITIFFICSCNLTDEQRKKKPYMDTHTGFRLIDAFISVYFISVGELFTENFKEPPNQYLIWPMFLLCNFLMAVVFMNMLIAIMGQTFSEVNETKIESGLEQKIALMCDYEDLIDVNKLYKKKKYIVQALPALANTSKTVDHSEEIEEVGQNLKKNFTRRFDETEKNLKQLIKQVNFKVSQIQRDLG